MYKKDLKIVFYALDISEKAITKVSNIHRGRRLPKRYSTKLTMSTSTNLKHPTIEELDAKLSSYVQYWTTKPSATSYRDWILERFRSYKVEGNEKCLPATHDEWKLLGSQQLEELNALEQALKQAGEYNGSKLMTMDRIFCAFKLAFDFIEREILGLQVLNAKSLSDVQIPPHIKLSLGHINVDSNALTGDAQLLAYLIDQLAVQGYRRMGSMCYEQIITEEGQKTRAWRPKCTLEKFVYLNIDKDRNFAAFNLATQRPGCIRACLSYLEKCESRDFPTLQPRSQTYAFRNGLLDLSSTMPVFHEHDSFLSQQELATLKYFDTFFDDSVLHNHWTEIQTEGFDSMFGCPDFSLPDTMRILYTMLGRVLHPVGTHDNWFTCPFFKAAPSSSILKSVLKEWFVRDRVAELPAEQESLSDATEFCLCDHVDSSFSAFDQRQFKHMLAGGEVVVGHRKNGIIRKWRAPLVMIGHKLPEFKSAKPYNYVFFEMAPNQVENSPSLLRKIRQEMGAVLLKCYLAYHQTVRELDQRHLYSILPAQICEWHDKYWSNSDSLAAFLDSAIVEIGATNFVPEQDFKAAYKQYIEKNGERFTPKDWAPDHYETVFCGKGITRELRAMNHKGVIKTQHYLLGVSLQDDIDYDLEDEVTNSSRKRKAVDELVDFE